MTAPPPPDWPDLLLRWSLEPVAVAGLIGAGVLYARYGRRERGPTALFGAGLGVVAVAVLSPIGTYAEVLFSVHMVQHLLLAVVAAPLLVAALRWRLRWRVNPYVAWLAFAATGWVVHLTGLFDAALRGPAVHGFEHALILATALLFWMPVFDNRVSHPVRILYLALAMAHNTFLALVLSSYQRVIYDAYADLHRSWGPSVLSDQRTGAGLMWVAGDLTLLVAVLAVAATWPSQEEGEEDEEDEDLLNPYAGGVDSAGDGASAENP